MEDHNRYYPVDPKGNVDEWGAVIKRQAEAHARDQESQKLAKAQNSQAYGHEL